MHVPHDHLLMSGGRIPAAAKSNPITSLDRGMDVAVKSNLGSSLTGTASAASRSVVNSRRTAAAPVVMTNVKMGRVLAGASSACFLAMASQSAEVVSAVEGAATTEVGRAGGGV